MNFLNKRIFEKNLNDAKSHLKDEELIKHHVFGAYDIKIMNADFAREAVLIATESRVIMYANNTFGFELESFPFEKISSIENFKEFHGLGITINSSGNSLKFKWIKKDQGDVPAFVEYVNSNIGQSQNDQIAQDDIPSQIKKLSDLKDQGILTDDEFSAKKAELLSRM